HEIVGEVSRFQWIKVETLTLQGELKTFAAEDFHARVIQHEIDHLNGVLFTEKMEPQDVTLAQPELKKLQKHYKSIQQNSKSRLTSIR
ncbi:MAG: peptide deformylase, partial [Planctomycetota bacterium]